MSRYGHYRDSARARNPEQIKHRLTPGSQPWKSAIIRDLREGYGVEDIALRLDCPASAVRDVVSSLRRHGLLPRLYAEARCNWRRDVQA